VIDIVPLYPACRTWYGPISSLHHTDKYPPPIIVCVECRLGPDVSASVKQAKVAVALDEVGLRDKADRYVGGELPGGLHLRGLSGGEKRRLSLVRHRGSMKGGMWIN
jgi:hypothetical protein